MPQREEVCTHQHPLWFRSILLPVPSPGGREARWGSFSHLAEGIKPQRGEVTHLKPQGGSQPITAHCLLGFPLGSPSVFPQSPSIPPPLHPHLCILVVSSLPSLICLDMGSWAWIMQTHLAVPGTSTESGKGDL